MKILVTGDAGFIGSNFLKSMVPRHSEHSFVNAYGQTYGLPIKIADDYGCRTSPRSSAAQTAATATKGRA
jgi:dTDP-D-glucose 4,6-dehydratase